MFNSSNRNNNDRPLHPASSGTETDFTPTSNPLNLTTPSSKRTTPSIGPSPAQTLHATPSNKNIAPVGQTQAISAPQGNQGKQPLMQNKATSTSDQLTPKRENQVASSETASAENGNDENMHLYLLKSDQGDSNPQAKRTPLPKRTAAPADLFSGDNVVDDDTASNTKVNGVKTQQDDIKMMAEKTTPPSTATKRKAAEEIPRTRDDDGKEDDRSSSGNTLARNEEEEEPFDPTAPVSYPRNPALSMTPGRQDQYASRLGRQLGCHSS